MLFGKEINHWYDIPIDDLILGIPRESVAEENRVSQTPETVAELVKLGFQVVVEKGAGENAQYHDEAYEQAGAVIVSQRQVWKADIVIKVQPPSLTEAKLLQSRLLISFFYPRLQHEEIFRCLQRQQSTLLAMDRIPRSYEETQGMDAVTSQAMIAGYRAVIEAAYAYGKPFLGHESVLGNLPPAKVFILGPLSPSRFPLPPIYLTERLVEKMHAGSVIVDMTARYLLEEGVETPYVGNCVYTECDYLVEHHGVKIVGYTDLPSRSAHSASCLYSRNILNLMKYLINNSSELHKKTISFKHSDEKIGEAIIISQGRQLTTKAEMPVIATVGMMGLSLESHHHYHGDGGDDGSSGEEEEVNVITTTTTESSTTTTTTSQVC
eukprot:gene8884-9800_t